MNITEASESRLSEFLESAKMAGEARAHSIDNSDAARQILRAYQLRPLPGANDDYRINGTALSVHQIQLPALRKQLGAVVITAGLEIFGGVDEDVEAVEEERLLTAMVRFLESGLRDGPHSRDIYGDQRIFVWDRVGSPG